MAKTLLNMSYNPEARKEKINTFNSIKCKTFSIGVSKVNWERKYGLNLRRWTELEFPSPLEFWWPVNSTRPNQKSSYKLSLKTDL